jgi:1-acyl-sn-glycerol-3-phosphate acyltransferase
VTPVTSETTETRHQPADGKHHFILKLIKWILKLFYPRHTIIGADQVHQDTSVVFVCNHLDTYTPIILSLYFPFPFRPWVHANMMTPDLCRDYLEVDFVRKTLKQRPPFSRILAAIMAPFCIKALKAVGSIPVFRGQMRIRDTINLSVEALVQGTNLVILPESQTRKFSDFLNDFHTGFVHLARQYHKASGNYLHFYPVFVSRTQRTITIGEPIVYSPGLDFHLERERIIVYLRNTINEMALNDRL